MNQSNNPSAIRSKKMLTDSLIQLMHEKPYQQITIVELVNNADLTRKTFYRNFNSKEDIINYELDCIFSEYVKMLDTLNEFDPMKIISIYFSICIKHKDFLTLLLQQELLSILYFKYQDFLKFINSRFQHIEVTSSLPYKIAFSAGGFFQILCLWLENGCKETPPEMVAICKEFL